MTPAIFSGMGNGSPDAWGRSDSASARIAEPFGSSTCRLACATAAPQLEQYCAPSGKGHPHFEHRSTHAPVPLPTANSAQKNIPPLLRRDVIRCERLLTPHSTSCTSSRFHTDKDRSVPPCLRVPLAVPEWQLLLQPFAPGPAHDACGVGTPPPCHPSTSRHAIASEPV